MTRPLRLVSAATAAVAVSGALLSVSADPALAARADRTATGSSERVAAARSGTATRYLVRYDRGTNVAAEARELRAEGVEVRRTFSEAVRAVVATARPAEAAALADSPEVAAVEVDARVHVTGTQSAAPWGLDRIDQRALPLSTTYTSANQGAGVDAYVVDTGVRADHVDLGGRVARGWSAVADGRGTGDCNGHGTHVAGTVGGSTYGVAKAVRIIPVRVLDCSGSGYMSDVVAGLEWVAAQHTAGTPAVVNLSLGGPVTSTVDAALASVIADGVVAAVAAGNSAADACTVSPARVPGAVTVAASNADDRQASFSNVGGCVDLYAPGVSITSAGIASRTATATMSGTSMAAPHAAGVAAILLAQDPTRTPGQVTARMYGAATPDAVASVTTGTPNRLLLLPSGEAAPTPRTVLRVPGAPTAVGAVAGRRAATVTWRQGSDGGSPVTRQSIRVYHRGLRIGSVRFSGSVTAVKVTGLRPGRRYRFTVTARNVVGRSAESARSNAVRPRR